MPNWTLNFLVTHLTLKVVLTLRDLSYSTVTSCWENNDIYFAQKPSVMSNVNIVVQWDLNLTHFVIQFSQAYDRQA